MSDGNLSNWTKHVSPLNKKYIIPPQIKYPQIVQKYRGGGVTGIPGASTTI